MSHKSDMADGPVLELSYTAREVDLFAREQERLANEHGSALAYETLQNMADVVPQYIPDFIHSSLARMESFVSEYGLVRFSVEWPERRSNW